MKENQKGLKILFVIDNLSSNCQANVNIVLQIVRVLKKKNIKLYALTRTDGIMEVYKPYCDEFDGAYSFYSWEANTLKKSYDGGWNSYSAIKKVINCLCTPRLSLARWDEKYWGGSIEEQMFRRQLEKICKEVNFDAVIGVSYPERTMEAVARAEIASLKFGIQLDPYTYNETLPRITRNNRLRCEKYIISKLTNIFTTKQIILEMKGKISNDDIKKYIEIDFPGIVVNDFENKKELCHEKNENCIKCVYAGTFYKDIRNPEFLLKLFTKLPENYELNIAGGGCEDIIDGYIKQLGDRLKIHGKISKSDADLLIDKADVLINVNNTVQNQLSSKIFELISTGKTILNICKTDRCVSIPYISKYPQSITLVEDDIGAEMIEMVCAKIQMNMGKVVSKKYILQKFEKNTDVYLADTVINNIIRVIYEKYKEL